jgi:16S rRNA processing protein RimM
LNELLTLASIVRIRGLRGEVVADFYSDFPERFDDLESVCLEKPGYRSVHDLESFWFQKGRIILKFRGIDNPESAQELVGCDVRIPEEQRFSLPEDHYYDSDLAGCRVIEKGSVLGSVKEVLKSGGGVSNLVIITDKGLEFMVPLVSEFCLSLDVEAGVIEVDLPPGMAELASPGSGKKS